MFGKTLELRQSLIRKQRLERTNCRKVSNSDRSSVDLAAAGAGSPKPAAPKKAEKGAQGMITEHVPWSVIAASSLPCTGLEPPESSLRLTDVGVCTPSEGTDNKVQL